MLDALQGVTDALGAVGGPMAVSAQAVHTETLFAPLTAIVVEMIDVAATSQAA